MKKKVLSLALALFLCLSLTVPAFAASKAETVDGTSCTVVISDVLQQATNDYTFCITSYTEDGKVSSEKTGVYSIPIYVIPDEGASITFKSKTGEFLHIRWTDYDWDADKKLFADGEMVLATLPMDQYTEYTLEKRAVSNGYHYVPVFFVNDDAAFAVAYESTFKQLVPAGSSTSPAAGSFTDVAADSPYAAGIAWAVEKGVTNGTGNNQFSPNNTCTVAQILTFLWRAYGEPSSTASCPFSGIASSSPYYKALCWAGEKGLVSGGSANDPCTRELSVTFQWKAAGSPKPTSAATFSDISASDAISWAVEKGITDGTGNNQFSPTRTCTRGQIVTFLYRELGK